MNVSAWFVGADELSDLRRTSTPIDTDGQGQVYVGGSPDCQLAAYVNAADARKIAAAWSELANVIDTEWSLRGVSA